MKRFFLIVSLLCSVPLMLTGCGLDLAVLVATVTDALTIVNEIASWTDALFQAHPNAVLQKAVAAAITRTRAALDAALRAARGGPDVKKGDLNAALQEFQAAYADLLVVVAPLGVHSAKAGAAARYGVEPTTGMLVVPEPLAMRSMVFE